MLMLGATDQALLIACTVKQSRLEPLQRYSEKLTLQP